MEPCLKPILKGHSGHVKVVAQALKAEITSFTHGSNIGVSRF
jgi:hypothetical protein